VLWVAAHVQPFCRQPHWRLCAPLPRHTQAPCPYAAAAPLTRVQIEGCPDASDARHQAAMYALCQVLDSAGQLCMHTAVLHPTNMQKLIAATLDDGRSGVVAEDRTRWAAVTHSLQLRCAGQGAQQGCCSPSRAPPCGVRCTQLGAPSNRVPLPVAPLIPALPPPPLHPLPACARCSPDQRAQVVSLRAIFLRRMTKVMEERRGILAKLQQVNIPDRMMALQSVISETLKVGVWVGGWAAGLVAGWVGPRSICWYVGRWDEV
jgi:hypothetical protein